MTSDAEQWDQFFHEVIGVADECRFDVLRHRNVFDELKLSVESEFTTAVMMAPDHTELLCRLEYEVLGLVHNMRDMGHFWMCWESTKKKDVKARFVRRFAGNWFCIQRLLEANVFDGKHAYECEFRERLRPAVRLLRFVHKDRLEFLGRRILSFTEFAVDAADRHMHGSAPLCKLIVGLGDESPSTRLDNVTAEHIEWFPVVLSSMPEFDFRRPVAVSLAAPGVEQSALEKLTPAHKKAFVEYRKAIAEMQAEGIAPESRPHVYRFIHDNWSADELKGIPDLEATWCDYVRKAHVALSVSDPLTAKSNHVSGSVRSVRELDPPRLEDHSG